MRILWLAVVAVSICTMKANSSELDLSKDLGEVRAGMVEHQFVVPQGTITKSKIKNHGAWGWLAKNKRRDLFEGVVLPGSLASGDHAGVFEGEYSVSGTGSGEQPKWHATLSGYGSRCWGIYQCIMPDLPEDFSQQFGLPKQKTVEGLAGWGQIATVISGEQHIDYVVTDIQSLPAGATRTKCIVEKSKHNFELEAKFFIPNFVKKVFPELPTFNYRYETETETSKSVSHAAPDNPNFAYKLACLQTHFTNTLVIKQYQLQDSQHRIVTTQSGVFEYPNVDEGMHWEEIKENSEIQQKGDYVGSEGYVIYCKASAHDCKDCHEFFRDGKPRLPENLKKPSEIAK